MSIKTNELFVALVSTNHCVLRTFTSYPIKISGTQSGLGN